MTTICIVRHGETDWNAAGRLQGSTDIPLNAKGVQQAKESGRFLQNSHWDVIITSPLSRARRTAEIINENLNIPLVVMEEFKEKYFGDVEGMTFEERRVAFPDRQYPNQEEDSAFSNRLMAGLEKINQTYKDQKVLLVAHGAVISAILAKLSNGGLGDGMTKIENACINEIQFCDSCWQINSYNQVSHLTDITEKKEMYLEDK
ncbi:histidine phosphatase family protein [Neobacillus mesonae]|uniref:Histidine phosphatase family protein n=1 Tax=Neobacillus mesonae TaxID=1193713 RepID=A0A3T0HX82_9BACI|nr:histidine phosphatase family protein [Neobacillus mesonae]AZU61725.1 histidine phosphatase family protein [Neobacillus mesonae]